MRVIATTGDVTNPAGALGRGTATLSRPQPPSRPSWPAGTSATASSYHAPNNGNDGRPRTYVPDNAIDGTTDTFWNDDTIGANEEDYPATSGPWIVTFDPPRGTPDTLQLTELSSLSLSTDFNTKYYSGTMIYAGSLHSSLDMVSVSAGARVLLDLGKVNEFAEVVLNGNDLDTILWRAPYRVDVTDLLVPGDNSIIVRVTNGWYNRVLGDLQPGVTERYSTRYNGQTFGVSPSGTINRSGLVGPISIVGEQGRQTIGTSTQRLLTARDQSFQTTVAWTEVGERQK